MQKRKAATFGITTLLFFSFFAIQAQAGSLEFLPFPDLNSNDGEYALEDTPVIIVPPPGTYSDDQDESNELEEPVSEDEETAEGNIINPEDLPIEENDGSGSIVVPPPGTYTDNQDGNNDALDEPVGEEVETGEGSVINPEDLPVEEGDHDGNIEAPPPGTPPDVEPPVTFTNPREDGHGTLPPQDPPDDVPPMPMPIPPTVTTPNPDTLPPSEPGAIGGNPPPDFIGL